jgi:hypothetical protein
MKRAIAFFNLEDYYESISDTGTPFSLCLRGASYSNVTAVYRESVES